MALGRQIGIMGGTFDPVHNGHIAIAQSVAEQLGLNRVLFIPTGNPNFKQDAHVTPAADRVRMVELAIEGHPLFELDRCEVDRPGVTYTADTLEELAGRFAGAQLFFIMGTDSALTLQHWKRAQDVARLCTVVVAQRPGQSAQLLRETLASCPIAFDVRYLDVPQIDVSSTQVRERVFRGLPIDAMVPDEVAAYIRENGLYS